MEAQNEQTDWRGRGVTHLFRLIKLCRMHDLQNEATRQALENALGVLREILGARAPLIDVVFAGDNIFVNGRPLQASRSTYRSVLELGSLLEEVGYNEITIRQGVETADLEAMLETYLRALDSPEERPPERNPTDRVRFRRIDPRKVLDLEAADRTAREQVLELYPAAVVTMRRFLDEVREGEMRTLRFVKRISQRLVALSDTEAETLLAVTAMKKTRDEPAGIAVNAAILALLMARRVTDQYRILHRTCFGAMVTSVGRPRASGLYGDSESRRILPRLDREGRERLGPFDALLLLKNSRMQHPALRRATVAYEAGWLSHKHDLGWPWGTKQRPAVESLIVEAARRFWNLMALKPSMDERRTPGRVFVQMQREAETKVEYAIVRLAMEVMGFYERGAVVETSKGWRGVVVEPGRSIPEFPRPVVRMVRDDAGNAVEPRDVDLADEAANPERFGVVRGVVHASGDRRLQEVANEVGDSEQPRPPSEVARPSHRRFLTGTGGRSSDSAADPRPAERDDPEPPPRDSEPKTVEEPSPSAPGAESTEPEVVMEFGPGSTKPTTHSTKPLPEQLEERSREESPAAGGSDEEAEGDDAEGRETFGSDAMIEIEVEESEPSSDEFASFAEELEAVHRDELEATRTVDTERARDLFEHVVDESETSDTRSVSAEESREILREFIDAAEDSEAETDVAEEGGEASSDASADTDDRD